MQLGASVFARVKSSFANAGVLAALAAVSGVAQAAGEGTAGFAHGDDLNEITVTAQRREQKLSDVGISITALGSDALKDLDIRNASDITKAVPSLKMNAYSSSAVVFNIRGVSQNDYGDQQEPPVAVYQDDSYSSSINLSSFPIFDLARVEVLRGPQGTLFGRNATGGAVQFISNKPSEATEGHVNVSFGRYNEQIYEVALSGPIVNGVQGRIAAIEEKSDGYIKNVLPGYPDFGGANHYALRGILAWEPLDNTNIDLTLRYMRAKHEREAGMYSLNPACPNGNFQGEFEAPNASCPYWKNAPGTTGSGYRNDAITPSRGGNPWATAAGDDSHVDRRFFGATLRIESTFSELSFISITDYQHSDKFYLEDGDASPDEGALFYQNSNLGQISQEFRVSDHFGAHETTAGIYGMRVAGEYTGAFQDPFYDYLPTTVFSQHTKSWAVFAQDEWKLDSQFKLIGGLRYWSDKREGSYYGSAPEAPGLTPPVTIIFSPTEIYPAGSTVTPADARKSFNDVTARLELDYKPIDDLLLFLSWNRGSKSGGFTFSTGTPYDPNEAAFLEGISFKPEVLNSYEFGTKASITKNTTLNANVFYYKYQNYQAFAQVGTVQSVINLNAQELGFEAELNSHPLEGLTLQLGTSQLSSRVKHILLPDLTTVVDHDLPQAPHFSGNALARYEFGVLGGTGSVQTDAQYSSRFCFTVLCAPVEKEPSYFVENARVGWVTPGGQWEFAGLVNNIFERQYRTYAFDSSLFAGVGLGVYAKPRTWTVTAAYRFGPQYK